MKSDNKKLRFTIVGTGAFGTAIANVLIKNPKIDLIMYGNNKNQINDINVNHKNSYFFGKKAINKNIIATASNKIAFKDADVILFALPTQFINDVLKTKIVPFLTKKASFINLSKGMDYENVLFIDQLVRRIVPSKYFGSVLKLSGPSFAIEVINFSKTVFSLACESKNELKRLTPYFENRYWKIYPTVKIREIEIISSIKNVFAILLGMVKGLGYKNNVCSYFFYLGLDEMKSILQKLDLDYISIFEPAGIGDYHLTTTSVKSRNYSAGYKIGKANKVTKKILTQFNTIEGLRLIDVFWRYLISKNINSILFASLYSIMFKKSKPRDIIEGLIMEDIK